jgi:DNA-binding beta-propeller fold protein YncE
VHVIATVRLEQAGVEASAATRLSEGTREIISTALYPQSPEGCTPCSVAVSPDGKTLFVANADQNSVMVADISGALMEDAVAHSEKITLVNGFIPVGWYPCSVAVSPDNKFLLVGNGKGLASRANWPPQVSKPNSGYRGFGFDTNPRLFEGSISFIPRPNGCLHRAGTPQLSLSARAIQTGARAQ